MISFSAYLKRTYVDKNGGGGLNADTMVLWAGGTSHILPLATIMSAREQVGPNRMAVLLDSDRAGLDKARKLIEMMAHGQDSVLLLGDVIGVPKAQAEDVPEFSELLAGLKELGRIPSTAPAASHGVPTNTELLRNLFAQNGWGELTTDEKARIMLELTNLWWKGSIQPAPSTVERARRLFAFVNERFKKLGSDEATPAGAGK